MTLRALALALLCAVFGMGQAPQQPDPEAKPASAGQAKPAAEAKPAAAPKPEPPKEKPFSDVVKDAQEIKGLFTLYRTEEKVYLELAPGQLEKIYMLSLTCDSGIGERGFYAAAMCGETPFVFHKTGRTIQLVIKNPMFTAQKGTPISRAVERSFSDSLLGSAKIESLPHPERKSVLIDLGVVLLADVPMLAYGLEATFRIPYRLDGKNTVFGDIQAFPGNVEIETVAHYAVDRPPLPPLLAPGAPAPPAPRRPLNLADIRSLLFHLRYSLSELPDTGYRPRLADDRVGHFLEQAEDFSTDTAHSPSRRYIARWNLEKQDPKAKLSRPKRPIVFWMENTIPVIYRQAIRDGILMWNQAFERIGFQDAIEVRQQPDDAGWHPADIRYSTVRWIAVVDGGFAQGPSRTNPFTGEIYDADIRFTESMTRFKRREYREQIGPLAGEGEAAAPFRAPWSRNAWFCDLTDGAARDAEFGFDLMQARGLDPESPEADKFVQGYLRFVSAHEVGHTLGLRHNFRSSVIHSLESLQDKSLTGRDGLAGSVMDYIPTNLAATAEGQGEYHQSTLGPYDYWAIEYAYKPIEASTPEGELAELKKIASRAAEPLLAYATDEDAGISMNPFDMDPTANRWDLGSDPLKHYAHRVKLGREIFANMEARLEKPGEGYQVLTRSFLNTLFQTGLQMRQASKFIGGIYHHRDHIGDPGGRLPFQPAPAARQREALALLRENLFSPRAFQFSPRLLNKLNNTRFSDFRNFEAMLTRFDVPVHSLILGLQKNVLDRLHHPIVLSRVLDSEITSPAQPFRLSELFTTLQDSIWAEAREPGEALAIPSFRRALQREHLRKLIGLVLRDSAAPEDARTLARHQLSALRRQVNGALAKTPLKMPLEARAHLEESLARIDEALKANMQRMAF